MCLKSQTFQHQPDAFLPDLQVLRQTVLLTPQCIRTIIGFETRLFPLVNQQIQQLFVQIGTAFRQFVAVSIQISNQAQQQRTFAQFAQRITPQYCPLQPARTLRGAVSRKFWRMAVPLLDKADNLPFVEISKMAFSKTCQLPFCFFVGIRAARHQKTCFVERLHESVNAGNQAFTTFARMWHFVQAVEHHQGFTCAQTPFEYLAISLKAIVLQVVVQEIQHTTGIRCFIAGGKITGGGKVPQDDAYWNQCIVIPRLAHFTRFLFLFALNFHRDRLWLARLIRQRCSQGLQIGAFPDVAARRWLIHPPIAP